MHPASYFLVLTASAGIFILCLPLTFVQDGVGRLVARQRLLAEVLVRLGQALHLGEASIERHGGVAGVLRHVEVRRPTQLLLDHQRLLQQLQDTKEVKYAPRLPHRQV